MCICGQCRVLPYSVALHREVQETCPLKVQLHRLQLQSSPRQPDEDPDPQVPPTIKECTPGSPIQSPGTRPLKVTISLGVTSDDPAAECIQTTIAALSSDISDWFINNIGSFAPRPVAQEGYVQLRRCCFIIQIGKTTTDPQRLHLTTLLINLFQTLISEGFAKYDDVPPTEGRISLLWLPTADCEGCGASTDRDRLGYFLPGLGCTKCGQTPARHHFECCVTRNSGANLPFCDIQKKEVLQEFWRSTMSPRAFHSFNSRHFRNMLENYTKAEFNMLVDPA